MSEPDHTPMELAVTAAVVVVAVVCYFASVLWTRFGWLLQ